MRDGTPSILGRGAARRAPRKGIQVTTHMGSGGTQLFAERRVEIEEEIVFSILSNQRRRLVVQALEQHEEANIEVGKLARQISAWENDIPSAEVDYTDRKSVYTSLQQLHLPKMDEAEIVEFDQNRGVVRSTDKMDEFTVYLEVVDEKDIPWHGYYLGLGCIGVSLLFALALDAGPFTRLPDLAWIAFLVVALLVSALAHTYSARQRRLGGPNDGLRDER